MKKIITISKGTSYPSTARIIKSYEKRVCMSLPGDISIQYAVYDLLDIEVDESEEGFIDKKLTCRQEFL